MEKFCCCCFFIENFDLNQKEIRAFNIFKSKSNYYIEDKEDEAIDLFLKI